MAQLSRTQFNAKIERVKQSVNIKDVIESTGVQPVYSNTAKGEYTYNAPYREDIEPSLKISVPLQSFIDHGGREIWRGDVIELTRIIHGHGDKNAYPFFKAVEWLETFSGSSVAPKAIQPAQLQKKPSRDTSFEGDRFVLVNAKPVTAKTHPANRDYITETRKISLRVASRYLHVITYRDQAAPLDDQYDGLRYGIGGPNDVGGWEVRAASRNSDFKMALGKKGVSTFLGHPDATNGHIFNGRFDFMTRLEITGENEPYCPTIVTNSDSLMIEAAQTIKSHPQLQQIKTWHVWQDNDESGDRSTQAFIGELNKEGSDYSVYTVNHWYEPHNDLNKCWTDAPADQITKLKATLTGNVSPVQKSYDTSASAEMRRTIDSRHDNNQLKIF